MSEEDTRQLKKLDIKLVWVILLTLLSAVSTSAVGLYRISRVEAIVARHEEALRIPRYTLLHDDERRTQDRREIQMWKDHIDRDTAKRERWMESINATILANAEFVAETRAAVREIKAQVAALTGK